MDLNDVLKMLTKLGKMNAIAYYLAERIVKEEETLLSLYRILEKIGNLFYSNPLKYDFLVKLLTEKTTKRVEFDIGSTWVTYTNGDIKINIKKPAPGFMVIDEWLMIWIRPSEIENYEVNIQTPYTWLSETIEKLKERNFSVRSLADSYIEKLKDVSAALNESLIKAVEEDVDKHVKSIKCRIESPIRKYLLPYYIWLMETNPELVSSVREADREKGLKDWFLSCLSILVSDKVRVSMVGGSLAISYSLSKSKALVFIELTWDVEREAANVSVDVFSPYTHREDIEWFIGFLEERLPRLKDVFEEKKRELSEYISLLNRIIKEQPELFL